MKRSIVIFILIAILFTACRASNTALPTEPSEQTVPPSVTDSTGQTQSQTGSVIPDLNPLDPMPGGNRVAFAAQYIRTNGYHEGASFPRVVIIRTLDELQKYYDENCEIFDLERKETVYSDTTIGFLDACDKYDAAYFDENILLMVLLEEGSGSVRHEVTDVLTFDSGELNIALKTVSPEIGTCDMAQWHIMIELSKIFDTDAGNVYINGKAWKASDSNPSA